MVDDVNAKTVTSAFLFGLATPPRNFLNPDIIRSGKQSQRPYTVELTASLADYMTAGPGRFAFGNQFDIVNAFFGPFGEALAPNTYTKQQLRAMWGDSVSNAIASFNQVLYSSDEETESQYLERVYIWGSTQFHVGDNVKFVVKPNGEREIQDYIVLPYNDGASLGPDNFDFKGGWFTSLLPNLQTVVDPSYIGRTVSLAYGGPLQAARSYTMANYEQDVLSFVAAKVRGASAGVLAGLGALEIFSHELFDQGVTSTLDSKQRPIFYGTVDADNFRISQKTTNEYLTAT